MTVPQSNPTHGETKDSSEQEDVEPKLTRRQMLALPIIAAAPNLTEAAKDADISESTLYRWRQNPHFRAELDRITHEIAETTREGLKELVLHGIKVIRDLMEDPDPTVRFRAARTAIFFGIQVCKAEDLRMGEQENKEACQGRAGERKDQ